MYLSQKQQDLLGKRKKTKLSDLAEKNKNKIMVENDPHSFDTLINEK